MSAAARWRGRVAFAVRERAEAWLPGRYTGMSDRDRKRWASAKSKKDLGEMVIAWLEGEIQQTPGHCGPPCEETIPLIPALTLANRAGFITDNSQRADRDEPTGLVWEAWVSGFASDAVLADLRRAISGTPLEMVACRDRSHECQRMAFLLRFCPWPDSMEFWGDCCPGVASELEACWYVTIRDPQPGRNDVLWPALERFAGGQS